MQQQGDVILKQTIDDGEITVDSGIASMDGGITTMIYICLFGGNEQDNGQDGNPLQYWGNRDETDTARQLRSETQNLIKSIAAVSSNLRRIEKAVLRDLQVFIDKGIATEIDAEASMPKLNTVQLDIKVVANGVETTITFTENWKATTQ